MTEKSNDDPILAFLATGKKIKKKIKAVSKSPVKYVDDAWHLKSTRLPRLRLPNLDTPPMSIELEYSMAKNMLEMTDARLEKKRHNLVKKMTFLNQEWKSLKHKEDMLKEEFRKFNKFLRTNMDKRERALKKYVFDRDTNLRRTSELKNLREKCECLKITLANMQREIARYSIYEKFLESVAQASVGEFKDMSEILPRVEALLSTKEAIKERHDQEMECLQDTVGYSIKFVGSKMVTVLNLTGLLPISKTKYEETQYRRLQLEYLLIHLKAKLTELLSDVLVHRNAIDVIYNQIRQSKNLPEDWQNDDRFFKVMIIGRTLNEFDAMRKLLEQKSRPKRSSYFRNRQSEPVAGNSRVFFQRSS